MNIKLDGREAEVEVCLELSSCDSYFEKGWFVDTGEWLSDEQLDKALEQNLDKLTAYIMDNGGWRD